MKLRLGGQLNLEPEHCSVVALEICHWNILKSFFGGYFFIVEGTRICSKQFKPEDLKKRFNTLNQYEVKIFPKEIKFFL